MVLPATLPQGTYSLSVIANGIASDPVTFDYAGPLYVDTHWAGLTDGTSITDADPVLAGSQPATVGTTAFASVNAAIAAAQPGQVVIVNGANGDTDSGVFHEAVAVNKVVEVYLQQGPVAFDSLAGTAGGASIELHGVGLTVGDDDTTTAYAGTFTGTGGLTKKGAGTLTLSSDNSGTYSGDVTISDGAIQLNNGKALANSAVTVGVPGGLAFLNTLTTATLGALEGTGNINLGSTALTVGGNNAGTDLNPITYSGNLSSNSNNPGSITKVGKGTWALSGNNSGYHGGVAINAGKLEVGSQFALAGSTVTVTFSDSLTFLDTLTAADLGGLAGGNVGVNTDAALQTLTVGGNGASTTFAGTLSVPGGSLVKVGAGTWTLANGQFNPNGGTAHVTGGTLLVTAGLQAYGGVTVADGATLGGKAGPFGANVFGPVTVAGALMPGGTAGPGQMFVYGDLTFTATGRLAARINGPTAGTDYDQVVVTGNGTVTLGGAKLVLMTTAPQPIGTEVTIIDNQGPSAVNNTFFNLPEGDTVFALGLTAAGGQNFTISYTAPNQTGQNVALTAADTPVEVGAVQAGAGAPSVVRSLTVTFTKAVTFAGGDGNAFAAFQLTRTGPGTNTGNVGLTATVGAGPNGQTVVTLTFSGPLTESNTATGADPSLIDGLYTLTVFSDHVTGPGGEALDGDADGIAGGDYTLHLHRLFGDHDGNRTVDPADMFPWLSNTLGRSAGDPLFDPAFDFDGNGTVDNSDIFPYLQDRLFTSI